MKASTTSTDWRAILRSIAQAILKAAGDVPDAPASTPTRGSSITAAGLTALVDFLGPIVRIVEGKGTIADDEAAANAVMNGLAAIDPGALPVVTLIETAEPVFAAIVGLTMSGGIRIAGGYPDIVGQENDRNFKNR